MISFTKPLKIILSSLLVISAVMFAMLYIGGNVEGAALDTPKFIDAFIIWMYILVAISIIITLGFEGFNTFKNPKKAFRTLISLGILVLVILISYFLADSTPLKMIGYTGTDNVPSMLILADMFIFTTYLIFGIAIILVLYAEFSRMFRKK